MQVIFNYVMLIFLIKLTGKEPTLLFSQQIRCLIEKHFNFLAENYAPYYTIFSQPSSNQATSL